MENKNSQDIGFAELFIDEGEREVHRTPMVSQPVRSHASLEGFNLLGTEHSYPSTREANFVHQARQWADKEGGLVPFKPFMSYWPTYSQMNGPQTEWYWYWRSEVRRKRYPETDLSYIFIYIYELIHGIGWAEPEEGFQLLLDLRSAYANRFPELLEYMADWLPDFVLVHRLAVPWNELITSSPAAMRSELFDLALTGLLAEERVALPLEFVLALSDYNLRRSSFYNAGGKEALEQHVPRVITLVDSYMAKTQGRRLKDAFDPGKVKTINRYLFHRSVYDASLHGRTIPLKFIPYRQHKPLRQYVTQLIRCTENKLREMAGFKGRLKGITLLPETQALIERFVEQEQLQAQRANRQIRINTDRLAALQQDTEEVQRLLTVENEESAANVQEITNPDPFEAVEHQNWIEPPAEPVEAVITDGAQAEEWLELRGRLQPVHLKLLSSLLSGGTPTDLSMLAEQYGFMPELLVDEINDAAMETIGDLLIEDFALIEEHFDLVQKVTREQDHEST